MIESAKFGNLTKSDIVEDEKEDKGDKVSGLKGVLAKVELPEFTKIAAKDLEYDIFTVIIRPPVLRYVATAFFTIATIGSILF